MKGVLILNMDIPKTCDDCLSGFRKTIGCDKAQFFDYRDIDRHPDCPLIYYNDEENYTHPGE